MMNTITHPETNKSHLKMDGLEEDPFGAKGLFSGAKGGYVLGS